MISDFFSPFNPTTLDPNFPQKIFDRSHTSFLLSNWQNLAKTNIVVALSYNYLWFIVQFASGSLQSYILKKIQCLQRERYVCICVCVYVCVSSSLLHSFILNFCLAINSLKSKLSVTIILALLVNTEIQIFKSPHHQQQWTTLAATITWSLLINLLKKKQQSMASRKIRVHFTGNGPRDWWDTDRI